MIFTVLWKFSAEGELAQLWIGAEDRQAISLAADRIDESASRRSDVAG